MNTHGCQRGGGTISVCSHSHTATHTQPYTHSHTHTHSHTDSHTDSTHAYAREKRQRQHTHSHSLLLELQQADACACWQNKIGTHKARDPHVLGTRMWGEVPSYGPRRATGIYATAHARREWRNTLPRLPHATASAAWSGCPARHVGPNSCFPTEATTQGCLSPAEQP